MSTFLTIVFEVSPLFSQVLVKTGDDAPGTATSFSGLPGALTAHSNSEFTFQARAGNQSGIWRGTPGNLSNVVLQGDSIAGTNNRFVNSLFFTTIPSNDATLVLVGISGPLSNPLDQALLVSQTGTQTLIGRTGGAAGNLGGASPFSVTYRDFQSAAFSDNSRYSYTATLQSTNVDNSNNQALFTGTNGSQELVARKGDTSPGIGTNYIFLGESKINSNGNVVFLGTAQTVSGNGTGIWLYNDPSSTTNLVVRGGHPAAGISGTTFESFNSISINTVEQLAFHATASNSEEGIWVANSNGSLVSLVVASGTAAPGTNSNFLDIGEAAFVSLNQVAFRASLDSGDGSKDSGIWARNGSGQLEAIAIEGEQAPGIEEAVYGATGANSSFQAFRSPLVSEDFDIAFFSTIAGENVDSNNDEVLWLKPNNGPVEKYAREGEFVEIAPGVVEQLTTISFPGFGSFRTDIFSPFDGTGQSLSNDGSLVYFGRLTDGRELLLSSRSFAVPEPNFLIGDVNQDEVINFLDISPFIVLLSTDGFQVEADINQDEAVNFLDISPFISLLSN